VAHAQPIDPDDDIILHFAAPPSRNTSSGIIDGNIIPAIFGNIYGWCDSTVPGANCSSTIIQPHWRTASFAGKNMADKAKEQYTGGGPGPCMTPAQATRWLSSHTWSLYNIGDGFTSANQPTPDFNPTSLYRIADGFDDVLFPNAGPKYWLTPWFRHPVAGGGEDGGLYEARAWFSEFLDEYISRRQILEVNTPALQDLEPAYISFDTEQVVADLSPNGTYILSRIHDDPRWDTMIVMGSNNKTLAQLWRDEWCPGGTCIPFDEVKTAYSLGNYEVETPQNETDIRNNRRIGIWWYRVNKMAHNAAMKYAFYDEIHARWPQCQVFNYGDVAHTHRLTTGNERLGWRFERAHTSLASQWSMQITNQGLLGVRNVFRQWLNNSAQNCAGGQPNGNFLCNAAAMPLYLTPPSDPRPDRWSFDPASWASNGFDIPGTLAAPVFYGVFTEQSQIDLNYPWMSAFNTYPTTPDQSNINATISSYFEMGRRQTRDIFDSMYFSGLTPKQVIPWICATGDVTFPNDGENGRPFSVATPLDTLAQLADLRANRMTNSLVFVNSPSTALGCDSADSSLQQKWSDITIAKRRAYAAKLTHIAPLRGTTVAGSLVANARSIGPAPADIPPTPTDTAPVGWKVTSELLPDEDGLSGSVQQAAVDITFQVRDDFRAGVGGGSSPQLFLESYISGDSIETEPGRMYARLQLFKLAPDGQSGTWVTWPVTDSVKLFDPANHDFYWPTNWCGMYTPDRSVRRTFAWPNTDLQLYLKPTVGNLRELRARLVVKKKSSEPFVMLLDRLQLVLGPFTAPSVGGGGGEDIMASPADVNQNDSVTQTDAEIFSTDFIAGAAAADVNNDGVVDEADVLTFVEAFGGGQ